MSYVYFARVGEYVKIGFSYRPDERRDELLGHSLPNAAAAPGHDCAVLRERRAHRATRAPVRAPWQEQAPP